MWYIHQKAISYTANEDLDWSSVSLGFLRFWLSYFLLPLSFHPGSENDSLQVANPKNNFNSIKLQSTTRRRTKLWRKRSPLRRLSSALTHPSFLGVTDSPRSPFPLCASGDCETVHRNVKTIKTLLIMRAAGMGGPRVGHTQCFPWIYVGTQRGVPFAVNFLMIYYRGCKVAVREFRYLHRENLIFFVRSSVVFCFGFNVSFQVNPQWGTTPCDGSSFR